MESLDDIAPYVIPTRGRDKIAHTHSYPIGAEALSKALADVPQIRELNLSFSAGRFFNFSGPWARRSDLQGNVFCTVLRVRYRRRGSSLGTQWEYGVRPGYSEPQWFIDVYPVFRDVRHLVRESLSGALPKVRDWLSENGSVDSRLGILDLTLTYNETDNLISFSNSENLEPDRVR
jgi:hypothetical protein